MKRVRKAKSKIFDITETQEKVQAISEKSTKKSDRVSSEALINEVSSLRYEVKQINQTQVKLAEAVSDLAMQVAKKQSSNDVQVSQQVDLSEPMEALLTQLVDELRQIQEEVHVLSSAQNQTELALSDVQLNATGEVHSLRSELSTVLEKFFQKALKEGAELTNRTGQESSQSTINNQPIAPPDLSVISNDADEVFLADLLVEEEDLLETELSE